MRSLIAELVKNRIKGMISFSILIPGIAITLASCATIPNDAPQAFFDADASLEELEDKDVDEYFPKTAEKANTTFEQALNELDRSRDDDAGASEANAIVMATQSKEMADGAIRLHDKIMVWDSSETSFKGALAMLDEMENPSYGVVDADIKVVASPFAKLRGSEIISTIAYFETDKSDAPIVEQGEMDALLEILQKDAAFQVELTGFADPRGSDSYNNRLAMKRADTIANALMKRGIAEQQIIIRSGGEISVGLEHAGDSRHSQNYVLSRKVRAKLIM